MRHPAETSRFFHIAIVATFFGVLGVAGSASEPGSAFSPFAGVLGWVLLAIGLINFAVHAVARLLFDHEMWRNTHFTEIVDSAD
ncbi:hypothetical protein ACFQZ4_23765 [Catellatospora coxensis]|uniref:Uncharacterized protein n=1 Tax=Catellatospora coxensis TaxID=310354 RepID=A0A8J3L1Y1_9ACTN|nr:hypothetical protein [Catellatospora coxensis]GIG10507.1 hypothetical protein Cco03nite_72070 [Catellatospora coxensis]